MNRTGSWIATSLAGVLLCFSTAAQVTQRVSVDSSGMQGNSDSYSPSISTGGRYVALGSDTSNLVAGDTNGWSDVFVRDSHSGATERVSVDSSGAQGNASSINPSISADGRYVAFLSSASNLVAGDTNGVEDVFFHDRQSGLTERVSIDSSGVQANGPNFYPSISADGRFVAFESYASNLVARDTNATGDVFLRDRQSGTTDILSVDSSCGVADPSEPFQTPRGKSLRNAM